MRGSLYKKCVLTRWVFLHHHQQHSNTSAEWQTDEARGGQGISEKWSMAELAAKPPQALLVSSLLFTSLPCHPFLITGMKWAVLLPKWLMGCTLHCPLWAGLSGLNYAVWEPSWVVMTGSRSGCCPLLLSRAFYPDEGKESGTPEKQQLYIICWEAQDWKPKGEPSIIYHEGDEPKPIWFRPNRIVPKMSKSGQEKKWK